jgi:2-polyprenyl-6-methoxyphenol hydroxylase-like FAD-dependent oxidoreductase
MLCPGSGTKQAQKNTQELKDRLSRFDSPILCRTVAGVSESAGRFKTQMKVLISGAGPAGLTAAYWLRRYGYDPTIVERASSLLVGGYKIDLRGAALQVLRQMEVHDAVVAAHTDMQGAVLVDKEGNVVNRMSGDDFGHRVGGDIEIVRGTLCQILRDHIGDVELLFGDTIQRITQSSNNTQVELTKNGMREFDCVIGADGLHSHVRRIVFGEESRFLRDLGLYLCVYSVPNYLNLDRMEIQYSELGRIAAIWSSRGDPNLRACFGFTAPSLRIDLRDRAQQQQALRTVYKGIGWEVPRLLEMMPTAPDWYFDMAAQIDMPRWSEGRVVLVGDAAYCASPLSGQGTSIALIGAYVLAGELAAASGAHPRAFAEFENVMRPFVQANQALGRRSAKLMRSGERKSVVGWLLKQLMRMVPGRMTEWLINRGTERITQAANAICLKDYSSFLRSKETPA